LIRIPSITCGPSLLLESGGLDFAAREIEAGARDRSAVSGPD